MSPPEGGEKRRVRRAFSRWLRRLAARIQPGGDDGADPRSRSLRGGFFSLWAGVIILGTILLLGSIALLIAGNRTDLPAVFHRHGPFVALALFLGAAVGASELVSRYRDAPMRALATNAGVVYITLMGVVSATTYGLLTRYAKSIIPSLQHDPLMTSVVAGFGAMAILRSKFFTLRTAKGEDIAVGPDAVISAFLDSADRGVDRGRASKRLALVINRTAGLPPLFKESRDFLEISLAALQNLSGDERAAVSAYLKTIAESSYAPDLKLQAFAYAMLNLAGESNFATMMTNLGQYLERLPPVSPRSDASSPQDTKPTE